MRKRIITMSFMIAMAISLIACSQNEHMEVTPEEPENKEEMLSVPEEYDDSTLEGITSGIRGDLDHTIAYLKNEFEKINSSIGGSYEGYLENRTLLSEWYALVLEEESAFFIRTEEKSRDYFRCMVHSIDHGDKEALDDARDDFFDDIYEDILEDFYDEIYEDLLEEAYDTYYDDILEDGYEIDPYEKWIDVRSVCYQEWLDARSAVYGKWLDMRTVMYQYWSAVGSGIWEGNFDTDALIDQCLEEMEKARDEAEKEEAKEEKSVDNEDVSDTIRPEFLEAMDNYEAFFDEYIEFMKKYISADQDELIGLLGDYTSYMEQYIETMESFEALENEEMSTEEALYYAEVANRISVKLLEVAY